MSGVKETCRGHTRKQNPLGGHVRLADNRWMSHAILCYLFRLNSCCVSVMLTMFPLFVSFFFPSRKFYGFCMYIDLLIYSSSSSTCGKGMKQRVNSEDGR